MTVEELHRALGGDIARGTNGPQVICPGPGHSNSDRSLAVSPAANGDGFIVFSHADDDVNACKDHVRRKLGLPPFQAGNGNDHAAQPQRKVIAKKYDYVGEGGNLLFQVVRLEPKDFRQRRPDGKGGWIWNLEGVRRVPYRLPEILEALGSERPVFVVEGEKDADALWQLGIPRTCNPQGAGKWRDEYSEHLKGATVHVIADNDAPGRAHAQQVAQSLTQVGAEVRVIDLPGVSEHGDASDWIQADTTAEQLYALADKAPIWPASEPKNSPISVFTFVGDAPTAPPRELIKGLLPAYGVAVTGGQSTAGKTFIQIYKSICLATAAPYFGHRIIERVGTAFVAAEGRALIPNRFAAGLTNLLITEKLPIA